MASYYRVQDIYDDGIRHLSGSPDRWKDICALAGQLYRYEFDNIVMVYEQRPKSTLIADYDTWKKVGRFVKRGSKGIAIFPSRALDPSMRHVFDVSDTGGRNVKLTWDLEGENLKDYADFLISQGQMEQYEEDSKESIKNSLKSYTGTNVWSVIKEEFSERLDELSQLFRGVIKDESKKRKGLEQDMSEIESLAFQSVMYAVGTRCRFDLSVQERDFSQFVDVKDEEIIYRLGSLVCDVSCSVLREVNRNIKAMESNRRFGRSFVAVPTSAQLTTSNGGAGNPPEASSSRDEKNERRLSHGSRNDLSRSGWTAVSGHRDANGTDRGNEELGQVRANGNDVSHGERTTEIQDTSSIREVSRQDEGSRGGSEQPLRPDRGAVSGEAQATESKLDNGDVEDQRAGENAGGGSSSPSGSDEVSLESEDEELKRELDELNSFGKSEEAGQYVQASFFDAGYGLEGFAPTPAHTIKKSGNTFEYNGQTYTYLEPKKEPVVPHEYVTQVVLRGTGFVQGKTRVCKIFEEEISATERVKRIKAGYGIGGAGWPLDGYGLHGYDTFHGKGVRFQWRDVEGEKEGYVSWSAIEKEIGALILTGEYQPEQPRIDELAMDGTREDEVIDAEFREVEEEIEENSSRVDDYAIPDEPESYEALSDIEKLERAYNEGRELTPEEGMLEDRLATMAEYGPEMAMPEELEADEPEEEVDRSQLQYIEPVDYTKKVMEMDEDLRESMEILVSSCSCYTPFRAFLIDLVATEDLFMPNRLDFLADIVLNGNPERKAYSNNAYGLIEYTFHFSELNISYKNRFGERVTEAVDYRDLYEVLTYMVKQPYFCGEDQKEYYQKTITAEDRSHMNPVYRKFLEKQEEIRENRKATKERAIANGWETTIDENGHVIDSNRQEATESGVNEIEQHRDSSVQSSNFHYNLWEQETGGPKMRFGWNVDAITTMKQIEAEGRAATPEEQQIMSKFVGWGGLSQAFDENNESWKAEYQKLKELLTEDEYVAAIIYFHLKTLNINYIKVIIKKIIGNYETR